MSLTSCLYKRTSGERAANAAALQLDGASFSEAFIDLCSAIS